MFSCFNNITFSENDKYVQFGKMTDLNFIKEISYWPNIIQGYIMLSYIFVWIEVYLSIL